MIMSYWNMIIWNYYYFNPTNKQEKDIFNFLNLSRFVVSILTVKFTNFYISMVSYFTPLSLDLPSINNFRINTKKITPQSHNAIDTVMVTLHEEEKTIFKTIFPPYKLFSFNPFLYYYIYNYKHRNINIRYCI